MKRPFSGDAVLLLSTLLALLMLDVQPPAVRVEPWRHVHGWLVEQRDGMAQDLGLAHRGLLQRAREAGDSAAEEELRGRPPEIRPVGYGVLPDILPDEPASVQPAAENRYSLKQLSTVYAVDMRDAALLARRIDSDEALPLSPWVGEFLRLRRRLRNLEENLNYHARWQQEVQTHRRWFESHNRIVDRIRVWRELDEDSDSEKFDRLERELHGQLAPFEPTSVLGIERAADGRARLHLRVTTDIEDADYLERVRLAVIEPFARAADREGINLRLEVQWLRISPQTLYEPQSPPAGQAIDREEHLSRFPKEALVFTTGVESTVALTGRAVILGGGEIAPRVLAHEFGHLLGFGDAYVRGFEGDPGSVYGAVLVEWVGLFDDLMGNPAGGEVSREMLEQLLSAYGPAK
jgi:hypothetical protein